MRHRIFLFQINSFKKYFYVSLGNNFFTVFAEAPLVVEALGNCSLCPLLNPVLRRRDISCSGKGTRYTVFCGQNHTMQPLYRPQLYKTIQNLPQ